jgi:hypothetical protein
MITWLFSDRGTVKSYRKMEGFGVNTYKWVNKNGKAVYIKYHWKPMAGLETIDRHEANRLAEKTLTLPPEIFMIQLLLVLQWNMNSMFKLWKSQKNIIKVLTHWMPLKHGLRINFHL